VVVRILIPLLLMNTADYSLPKENEPVPTMEAPAVLALYKALENLGVQLKAV
jgi:hypothetical protein